MESATATPSSVVRLAGATKVGTSGTGVRTSCTGTEREAVEPLAISMEVAVTTKFTGPEKFSVVR